MENLDTITEGLIKLRAVAAFYLCCDGSAFSLRNYSAWVSLEVWKVLGITTTIKPGDRVEENLGLLRKGCKLIEQYLVENDFDESPLAPPYVIGRVKDQVKKGPQMMA